MLKFYPIGMGFLKTVFPTLTRWKVIGKENIPENGPLLIVANHLHNIDPPLLSASIPLKIVFMAKQELFESPFIRSVVCAWGAFPVQRNKGDLGAVRQGIAVLKSGGVLGMFPEGQRSRSSSIEKPDLGAALIGLRAGVPVLPVGITGTEKIKGIGFVFRRPRITVTIGQTFLLPVIKGKIERNQLIEVTDYMMEHIARLLPESYRGLYTGNQPLDKQKVESSKHAD